MPSAADALAGRTIAALRGHAPFDRMDADSLRYLADRVTLAYYARSTLIRGADDAPVDRLYILKQGQVRGRGTQSGEPTADLVLGAGECFPVGALIGRRATVYEYRAESDVFCWELPAADFHALVECSQAFHAFCTNHLAELLERARRAQRALSGEALADEAGMLAPLRSVLARPAVWCAPDTPVRDVLQTMRAQRVGSMVVAVEGRMKKGEYRKFKIRGLNRSIDPSIYRSVDRHPVEEQVQLPNTDTMPFDRSIDRSTDRSIPDDFAAIHEVVLRRYRRVLEHGGPFPDLILIDGGKGQLTAAYAALREVGLDRLVAIGIAKQEELLFTRDRVEGLALPRESSALRLIQRIRDEAHRFAITFHRRSRTRRDLRSALDDVPGIGARRRKQLLTTFGSVAGVRRASRQELEAAVGAKTAEAVIRHFGGG